MQYPDCHRPKNQALKWLKKQNMVSFIFKIDESKPTMPLTITIILYNILLAGISCNDYTFIHIAPIILKYNKTFDL